MKAGLICAFLALGLASCGGSDDPPSKGDTDRFAGSVSGTITYTGTGVGTLIVSVGRVEVPTCPTDVPADFTLVAAPIFPYAYSFNNLPEGNYYLFGFLDVNADAGDVPCPKADDICGRSTPATPLNSEHPAATIDVTLDLPGCTI